MLNACLMFRRLQESNSVVEKLGSPQCKQCQDILDDSMAGYKCGDIP